MAAAIVAIRKNSTAAGFTPEEGININEDLTDEDCIKSGMLHRKSLSERGHWFPRFVILTWNELTFCKVSEDGKRSRVDHIPLHEIVLVSIQDMEDDEDNAFSFVIHVVEDGRDNGRPAFLKAESRQEMDEWVALIRHHSRAEIERLEAQEDTMPFAKERRIVRQFYASDKAQIIFGGVIVVSYGFAIIESEMRPEDGSSLSTTLFVFEALFTTIFGIELVINLFGNWLYPFFRSPWNVFDAFVVFISVLGLIVDELPGARPTSFSSPAPRACARIGALSAMLVCLGGGLYRVTCGRVGRASPGASLQACPPRKNPHATGTRKCLWIAAVNKQPPRRALRAHTAISTRHSLIYPTPQSVF
jgi:hypothetical protein